MSRFMALLAGASLAAVAIQPAHAEGRAWRFQAEALGTSLDMVAVASDHATALVAAQAARAEIARLDAVLSRWRDDSELSALNGSSEMTVSPDLFRVIEACERWRAATDGAFDGRLGRLEALWRDAETSGALPELTTLGAVRTEIDKGVVKLDVATRTVVRPEAVVFAPDALAKGYVIDAALAAARKAAPGLSGLMVDIGGDLRCWGANPNGWIIGVSDGGATDNTEPAVLIDASGRAVATSGRSVRDFQVGDAAYPHLLGPHANTATVVGPTAAEADALSTALAVMAPEEGLALVERLDGFEARVIRDTGEVLSSSGWTSVDAPRGGQLIRAASAAGPAWPAGFQVRLEYNLPRFEGARVYSPYVAIWVTDEANRLVRALTMLGDNLDYVGENYIWWRRFARSRPQMVQSVSRPTRKAGRYTAVWDGKDDAGRPVGQGRYTLHIEATREHGGHSYQSIPLPLGAAPTQGAAAPPGPTATEEESELGPSIARYGPGR